jgi:hypothetical protein
MRWISLYSLLKSCVVKLAHAEVIEPGARFRNAHISADDLQRLLVALSSDSRNVGFRCRPVGEAWMKRYCRISNVRDNTVVLYDEKENKFYLLNIDKILQFDVNERWQNFKPHHHYSVQHSQELQEI